MCPDIETYAPLIAAGFGLGDVVGRRPPRPPAAGPARRPGARPRPTRCSASRPGCSTSRAAGPPPAQVLDLAAGRPVRRRFGFSDDDLDAARPTGSRESGVRWGFDAEHRRRVRPRGFRRRTPGGPGSTGCSRRRDVRRLRAWLGRGLPLDDVGSCAGRPGGPARRVRRPAARRDRPAGRQPTLDRVAGRARRRGRRPDPRAATTNGRPASCSASSAGLRPTRGRRAGTRLRLPDVRALLAAAWPAGPPGPTSAPAPSPSAPWCRCGPCRTGWSACSASTTGCSRGSGAVDGDDVLARDPMTGERDSAARTGSCCSTRSWRPPSSWWSPTPAPTNAPASRARPPCRWVSCSTPSTAPQPTAPVRDGGHRRTPAAALRRQEHHARRPGRRRAVLLRPRCRGGAGPRSARACRRAAVPRRPAAARPPARGRVAGRPGASSRPGQGLPGRDGVDVALPADEDHPEDALPVEIDNLAQWSVGDRVLGDLLAGSTPTPSSSASGDAGCCPPAVSAGGCSTRSSTSAAPLCARPLRSGRPSRGRSTSASASVVAVG